MRDLLYAQVSYTFVSSPLASLELLFFPKMDEIQVEVDAKTFQILYTVLLLLNLDWWRLPTPTSKEEEPLFPKKYFPIFTVEKEEKHLPQCLVEAASNVRLIAGKEKM